MIKNIGELLKQYMRERGWSAEDPYARIFLDWKGIVGDSLGLHSRAIEIEGGILTVEVDHPGWMQTFLMRKTTVLAALRQTAPEARIRDLKLRLGGGAG
jgi:predicted nucleic acid-binding Zn ribbon protein